MASPREILSEFNQGRTALAKADPERMQGWLGLRKAAFPGGVLDAKTKELIAAGIGLSLRCKYCIVVHVYQALEAGATREELIEAAYTAVGMGGGPTLSYAGTLFLDAINEFAPDFGNSAGNTARLECGSLVWGVDKWRKRVYLTVRKLNIIHGPDRLKRIHWTAAFSLAFGRKVLREF